jgi:hypothetical protein
VRPLASAGVSSSVSIRMGLNMAGAWTGRGSSRCRKPPKWAGLMR